MEGVADVMRARPTAADRAYIVIAVSSVLLLTNGEASQQALNSVTVSVPDDDNVLVPRQPILMINIIISSSIVLPKSSHCSWSTWSDSLAIQVDWNNCE